MFVPLLCFCLVLGNRVSKNRSMLSLHNNSDQILKYLHTLR